MPRPENIKQLEKKEITDVVDIPTSQEELLSVAEDLAQDKIQNTAAEQIGEEKDSAMLDDVRQQLFGTSDIKLDTEEDHTKKEVVQEEPRTLEKKPNILEKTVSFIKNKGKIMVAAAALGNMPAVASADQIKSNPQMPPNAPETSYLKSDFEAYLKENPKIGEVVEKGATLLKVEPSPEVLAEISTDAAGFLEKSGITVANPEVFNGLVRSNKIHEGPMNFIEATPTQLGFNGEDNPTHQDLYKRLEELGIGLVPPEKIPTAAYFIGNDNSVEFPTEPFLHTAKSPFGSYDVTSNYSLSKKYEDIPDLVKRINPDSKNKRCLWQAMSGEHEPSKKPLYTFSKETGKYGERTFILSLDDKMRGNAIVESRKLDLANFFEKANVPEGKEYKDGILSLHQEAITKKDEVSRFYVKGADNNGKFLSPDMFVTGKGEASLSLDMESIKGMVLDEIKKGSTVYPHHTHPLMMSEKEPYRKEIRKETGLLPSFNDVLSAYELASFLKKEGVDHTKFKNRVVDALGVYDYSIEGDPELFDEYFKLKDESDVMWSRIEAVSKFEPGFRVVKKEDDVSLVYKALKQAKDGGFTNSDVEWAESAVKQSENEELKELWPLFLSKGQELRRHPVYKMKDQLDSLQLFDGILRDDVHSPEEKAVRLQKILDFYKKIGIKVTHTPIEDFK